jgi:hypothetical protein
MHQISDSAGDQLTTVPTGWTNTDGYGHSGPRAAVTPDREPMIIRAHRSVCLMRARRGGRLRGARSLAEQTCLLRQVDRLPGRREGRDPPWQCGSPRRSLGTVARAADIEIVRKRSSPGPGRRRGRGSTSPTCATSVSWLGWAQGRRVSTCCPSLRQAHWFVGRLSGVCQAARVARTKVGPAPRRR